MTRVAIMQPTYLPWCGYFGLMQYVDIFVFLDTVQFSRRSWQQRNQIKTANGPQLLTVPVIKGKRNQRIIDVEIDHKSNYSHSHRRSIELNYRKALHYEEFSTELLRAIERSSKLLVDLNISLILQMKALLGIDAEILRSSQLSGQGKKAELLASLCQQVGATEYISPPGSREYLEASEAFENISVPVHYFQFEHPEYAQMYGEFLPYMSCVDMLFNCGPDSMSLINSAYKVLA